MKYLSILLSLTTLLCAQESKNPIKHLTPYCQINCKPNQEIQKGQFYGMYWNPLPDAIVQKMKGKSWNDNTPVPLKDLAYIQVTHWDFHNEITTGELIFHKSLALELLEIFQELFEANFPIEKMVLIDHYDANDDLSMSENNTYAFCSRKKIGKPEFSNHSYGKAIDINPLINPYFKAGVILPKEGKVYLNRNLSHPGLIKEGSVVYQAFIKRGYFWGGHWTSLKDYQHFEKVSN